MNETDNNNYKFPCTFYDKCTRDDENMLAKIKPLLNQIHESRVVVKELHTQYGIRFSAMMNSYRNRLEDIQCHYETLISEIQNRQKSIQNMCDNLLNSQNYK